jgi:exosortase A
MFYHTSVFKLLLLSLALWGLAFFASIESTAAIWYRSDTFAHCFIILPICIYLINQKWHVLRITEIKPNLKVLIPILAILLLWLLGALAQLLVVEQGAAFLMLPLIVWCLLGNKVARVLVFTMEFGMFSVPVGEFLIPQLQELTADITVWALKLTGIPVFRDGLYIAVPGGLFEVAVACSGIRYLIASFTLGTLFAYLNYSSLKKRSIFVLFSIFLPLLANGIRAFGIVIIAYSSDMKYATGVDHLIYGWLFFGVVILIMFSIGGMFSDPAESIEKDAEVESVKTPISGFVTPIASVLLVVGVAMVYKAQFADLKSDMKPDFESIFSAQRDLVDDSWLPIFQNPSIEVKGEEDGIDYFIAYYDSNLQDQELINSSNKLYNYKAWTVQKITPKEHYTLIEITNIVGERRLVAYTYVTGWVTTPSSLKVKISQAFQALVGQPQSGMVLVMSIPLSTKGQERELLLEQASAKFKTTLSGSLVND